MLLSSRGLACMCRIWTTHGSFESSSYTFTTQPLLSLPPVLASMLSVKAKVPESVQSKSVTLQVGKKTMKEIISDLDLEVSGTSK